MRFDVIKFILYIILDNDVVSQMGVSCLNPIGLDLFQLDPHLKHLN